MQAPESLAQFTSNSKYQVIEGTTNGEVVLSFNNAKAPLNDVRVRQAVRYAIDHKALMDTCWAGRGKLIGSMVPPTDPWYEDLTGDLPATTWPRPRRCWPSPARRDADAAAAAARPCRMPSSCGQVVKSQLEQVGITVNLDQLEFPAAWLTTVFKNADYDMSIVAHVEPRDMRAVFGTRSTTRRYNNPHVRQADIAAADAGHRARSRSTDMKKAARRLSRGRRRRLAVPAAQPHRRRQGHHRAAEERHHRVVRPVEPGAVLSHATDDPDAAMVLRVLQRTARAARRAWSSARCWCSPSWRVLPGDPARVALGVNASDEAVAELRAAVRPRPAAGRRSTSTGSAGCCAATSGTSYVSRAPIGPQVADRLQVTLVAGRWPAWSSRW